MYIEQFFEQRTKEKCVHDYYEHLETGEKRCKECYIIIVELGEDVIEE